MDIPGFDPSILQRPMSELSLNNQQSEGIQVTGADALMPAQTEGGDDASQTPDGESKVPYRRFKKFHDAALEAQKEADFWKARAMDTQTRPEPTYQSQYQVPAPNTYVEPTFQGPDWDRFKALFSGAEENAVKEAYRMEVQRISAVEDRAMRRAEERWEQRSQNQRQELRANRGFLDDWTDQVSDLAGRDLNDDEQVQLLDIMDEYSPKDSEDRIEAPISPESALRIFQMQASQHSARRQVRNALAATSSASSGGDISVAQAPAENNQNFNAQLGWRANFRKMTGRDPDKT